ncbi:MAG: alpha/beta hydrolase [Saprospiraceae bacterium]|nr:alpha/beta hydrolase [Saprospiraceae bacterium]
MQTQLVYQSSGEGSPFHFQHGLGSNLTQPQGLLANLEGVRLISMDCPGHGAAALPPDFTPSFAFYSQQVIQLMDQLQISEAIFGGISMGAGISTYIALHYPERVKALVLVRPAWLDQGTPENLKILLTASDYIDQAGNIEGFKQEPSFQTIHRTVPNAARSVLGVFAETQRAEISRVLRAMVKDQPFEDISRLQNIKSPTLIIGNEDDPLHPYRMAETMHQHLPNSKLEKVISRYIDDVEHRQTVVQIVSKFIDNL